MRTFDVVECPENPAWWGLYSEKTREGYTLNKDRFCLFLSDWDHWDECFNGEGYYKPAGSIVLVRELM